MTGELRSWARGERHTGTNLEKSEIDRPSSQGCPRRLKDEMDQITQGCRNPFAGLVDTDRSWEGAIRARGEFSL